MSYYKDNKLTMSKSLWYNPETGETSNRKESTGWKYFASQFEFLVFQKLTAFCRYRRTPLEVATQQVVCIKPPSRQLGQLQWKIDAVIRNASSLEELAYIEAKGGWLRQNTLYMSEFCQKLHLWDGYFPDQFSKFYLVGDQSLQKESSMPVKVWDINLLLKELNEIL